MKKQIGRFFYNNTKYEGMFQHAYLIACSVTIKRTPPRKPQRKCAFEILITGYHYCGAL